MENDFTRLLTKFKTSSGAKSRAMGFFVFI